MISATESAAPSITIADRVAPGRAHKRIGPRGAVDDDRRRRRWRGWGYIIATTIGNRAGGDGKTRLVPIQIMVKGKAAKHVCNIGDGMARSGEGCLVEQVVEGRDIAAVTPDLQGFNAAQDRAILELDGGQRFLVGRGLQLAIATDQVGVIKGGVGHFGKVRRAAEVLGAEGFRCGGVGIFGQQPVAYRIERGHGWSVHHRGSGDDRCRVKIGTGERVRVAVAPHGENQRGKAARVGVKLHGAESGCDIGQQRAVDLEICAFAGCQAEGVADLFSTGGPRQHIAGGQDDLLQAGACRNCAA